MCICVHTHTHVCLQTDETTLFSSLAPPVALTTCSSSGGHMTHSLTLYRALWRCPTAKRPRGLHRLLCEHHEDMWPSWRPIIPYGRQTPRTTAPQSSCELQWRINEWEDERARVGWGGRQSGTKTTNIHNNSQGFLGKQPFGHLNSVET